MIKGLRTRLSLFRGPLGMCLILVGTRALDAQMPGLPVLQNGFSNAGITIAGNYGRTKELLAYGAAVAWSPSSGRFQLSAGGGLATPEREGSGASYGARVAMAFGSSLKGGRFGLAPFAGMGAAKFDGKRVTQIPAGVGAGFRARLGATRGVAVFASPFYSWTQVSEPGLASRQAGLLRVSVGADVALFPKMGLTLGWETGAIARDGDPGATGGIVGAGVSYAFR